MDKVNYKDIKEAVIELNESGLIDNKINFVAVERKDLISNFIDAVIKLADEGKEDYLSDKVIDIYNNLVEEYTEDEQEVNEQEVNEQEVNEQEVNEQEVNEQEVNEQEVVVEDEFKKNKKRKYRNGSRPALLYSKILENSDINVLLQDEELLEKYKNHKSWIKNDYAKIIKEI